MSSEILYVSAPAQGACMLEGHIFRRDMASLRRSSGALGLGGTADLGLKPRGYHDATAPQPIAIATSGAFVTIESLFGVEFRVTTTAATGRLTAAAE